MQSGKIRAAFRLLLALILTGWGQFVWAQDYFWKYESGEFSSPAAACTDAAKQLSSRAAGGPTNVKSANITRLNDTSFRCDYEATPTWNSSFELSGSINIERYGDSCPSGGAFNPADGTCSTPKQCSTNKLTVSLECTWIEASKTAACPDQVSADSCGYLPSGNSNTRCYTSALADAGKKLCVATYSGTGQESNTNPLPDGTFKEQPNSDPNKTCVKMGDGVDFCYTNSDKGCGTFNGKEGCFQSDQNCGYVNGTFTCVNSGSNNRNCGYANGQQVCFNPKDPTKIIDPSSSDHPANGGNGDGDDSNDPKPAGSGSGSTGSNQGSDAAATNKAVQDAGDKMAKEQGKSNDLLGDIKGLLEDLLGKDSGEYQGEGDGAGNGTAPGDESGKKLADEITKEGDALLKAREDQQEAALNGVDTVVDSLFPSVDKVFKGTALDNLLPKAESCGDFILSSYLGKYPIALKIPVCDLTRAKALLEYVLWIVTMIGLFVTIKRIAFLETDGGGSARR